jgi:hypothetical protein
MLVDQNTEEVIVPLNAELPVDKGRLELANSTSISWLIRRLLTAVKVL